MLALKSRGSPARSLSGGVLDPVPSLLKLCCLFALPQAVCRLGLVSMNWPRSPGELVFIALQGILEDATIALQSVAVALALCKALHRHLRWVALVFVNLLSLLPPIVDFSVQRCGFARITRVEIEATVSHWRHMTSSMVDRAFCLEAYLYVLAFALVLYGMTRAAQRVVRPVRASTIAACVLSAIVFANVAEISRWLLPRASAYLAGNLMFTLEFGQIPMKAGIFDRWPASHIDLRLVLDPTEVFNKSGRGDIEFPLWRQTWAYRGPSRFQLDLDPARPRPNILLINMESWSHEVTSRASKKYAAESLTPYFDRLAAEGIQFKSHFNPGLTTTNTLFSELFGLKPRFSYNPPFDYMAEPFRLHGLPQLLNGSGYACKMISGASLRWHNWRTFLRNNTFTDIYDDSVMKLMQDEIGMKIPSGGEAWGFPDEFSFRVLEQVVRNSSRSSTPFFISFYSISSHDPFRLPDGTPERDLEGFRSGTKLDRAHMRSIRYSDRQLGTALMRLRESGLLSNAIIMITGDHGRLMGDGSWSRLDYEQFRSDPYSHVPFAIVPSADLLPAQYRGMRVHDLSSHVDILATLADMLQLTPFWQHGIGASLMRHQDAGRKVIVDQPQPGHELVSVLRKGAKFVFDAEGRFCAVYNRTVLAPAVSCRHPRYANETQDVLAWAKRVSTWTSLGYRKRRFLP